MSAVDGFSIYHYRSIKNKEKERVNKIVQNRIAERFADKTNPNYDLKALFSSNDTVNYYKMILKQDDNLALDTSRTHSRKLAVLNRQEGTVKLNFADTVMIKYQPLLDFRFPKLSENSHGPSTKLQYTFMYPIESGGVNIERNGYYPELILFIYGNMSERRISQLLPWDYDPDKILQILSNLLSNALKFVPEGRAPQVRVFAEVHDGMATIRVTDNGIGIAPEHVARLFQPFQRLHRKSEYEGTGLGLALSRQIAEAHGGRIEVQPGTGGEGTCFVVTLPLQGP